MTRLVTLLVLSAVLPGMVSCAATPDAEAPATGEQKPARQFGPDKQAEDEDFRDAIAARLRYEESLLKHEHAVERHRIDLAFAQKRLGYAKQRLQLREEEEEQGWLSWWPNRDQRRLNKAEKNVKKLRRKLKEAEADLEEAREANPLSG